MKKVTDWIILALVLAVFVDLASAAKIVDGPDPVATCEVRSLKSMASSDAILDGAGMCSLGDYASCVTQCVDEAMPWEYVRAVNCVVNYYNRSYSVASCQCFFNPLPIPTGGLSPRTPDVGANY